MTDYWWRQSEHYFRNKKIRHACTTYFYGVTVMMWMPSLCMKQKRTEW